MRIKLREKKGDDLLNIDDEEVKSDSLRLLISRLVDGLTADS